MRNLYQWAIGAMMLCCACSKYLEAVPDNGLAVPSTVADLEQLLQQELMFNNAPAIGEFGTDDIYMPDALLASQNLVLRNGYIWAKDIYEGATSANWNNMYSKIYNANIVLSRLDALQNASAQQKDFLKGWALFCRVHAYYDLAQVYAQPYKAQTAASDLGLPIKLGTNLAERVKRSSVEDTYKQMIGDLEGAIPLLPPAYSQTNRSIPCRAAGYALLARLYLNMQNYSAALDAAEQSLKAHGTLVDYNTFNAAASLPFSPLIDEVTYNSIQLSYSHRNWQVDRTLYDSFSANDLRKTLFFTFNAAANTVVFKGWYSNIVTGFNGFATDEVYLIKAECQARLLAAGDALNTLNTLLVTRFKKDTYVPYTTSNTTNVLSLILAERRKECIFRNLRWPDLRRLNQDSNYAITISRVVNGTLYQLAPNDARYTLPIPDDEIRSSGIEQNPR